MANIRCSVFHQNKIAAFRRLGIKKILTVRTQDEIIEDWDIQANSLLEEDLFLERTWIEVEDQESSDLLRYFPPAVTSIKAALRGHIKVYVHWYLTSAAGTDFEPDGS